MGSRQFSSSALLCTICAFALGLTGSAAAADPQSRRILIDYVAPKNPEHRPIYDLLKERRALEKLQEIFGAFRLPNDLTLRTLGCDGVSNAWYERSTVSVCYEYLDEIRRGMPKETMPAGVTPTGALVGQFFYVFAHEMGHASFDLLGVPVFGRPEDAADQFATYIMLQFGKEQARELITGAAYSYKKYLQNPNVTAPLTAFSDAHSPPAERFYNLLCMAYGAEFSSCSPTSWGKVIFPGRGLQAANANTARSPMHFTSSSFPISTKTLRKSSCENPGSRTRPQSPSRIKTVPGKATRHRL